MKYYLKNWYDERDSGLMFSFLMGVMIFGSLLIQIIVQPFYSSQDTTPQWAQWVMQGFLYLVLLGAVILYHKMLKINVVKANGLDKKFTLPDIIMSVILGAGMLFTFLIFTFLFSYFLQEAGYKDSGAFPQINSVPTFLIAIIIMCVLPAVVEEIVFRGAVLSGFSKVFHIAWSIVLSALFFMLMHMNPAQIINPILTGIVMAVMVNKTKTIKVSMIAHFVNNFIVVLITYIESFSKQPAQDGEIIELENITEYLIYFAIGIVLLAGALVYFFLTRKKSILKTESEEKSSAEELVFENGGLVSENKNTSTQEALKKRRSRAFLYSLFGIAAAVLMMILTIVIPT